MLNVEGTQKGREQKTRNWKTRDWKCWNKKYDKLRMAKRTNPKKAVQASLLCRSFHDTIS